MDDLQQEIKKGNSKIWPKYLYQAPTYNKASPLENDASSHTFSMWIGFWLGAPKQRRKKNQIQKPPDWLISYYLFFLFSFFFLSLKSIFRQAILHLIITDRASMYVHVHMHTCAH